MSGHVLERSQVVPGDMATVFGFFKDPKNLEALTPPWLRFEVKASTDERVRDGTEIEYRLWWQIFPMKWRSRIRDYVEGSNFADEMLEGPYRRWYHRHQFNEVPGGIEIVDVVSYELPFGPLGRLVHALVVRRQLEAIFEHRREATARIFAAQLQGAAT